MGRKNIINFGIAVIMITLIIAVRFYFGEIYNNRQNEIKINNCNVNKIDFNDIWGKIKEKYNMPDSTKVNDFNIKYYEDGKVESSDFEIITLKEGFYKLYEVTFALRDKEMSSYYINVSELEDKPLQFDKLIIADKFFNALSTDIDFNSMRPEKNYKCYSVDLGTKWPTKEFQGMQKFNFQSGKWVRVSDEEFDRYEDKIEWSFYFYGWKSIAESVYTGTDYIMYSYYK